MVVYEIVLIGKLVPVKDAIGKYLPTKGGSIFLDRITG